MRIKNMALITALICTSVHAAPIGWLDAINQQTLNSGEVLTGSGWAADFLAGSPVRQIDIQVDGRTLGYGLPGGSRPDVAAAFGRTDFELSGYSFAVNVGVLAPGQHTVTVWAWTGGDAAPLTGSGTFTTPGGINPPPVASIIPSSTSITFGQSVNFTISGSSVSGLNEIGLELCDSDGTAIQNLGFAGVGGNSASSFVFTWTAPSPGTYRFDAYAWNADRSQLTRSATTTVIVSTPINYGYINILPSVSYGRSGETQTISYSINDGGLVSSSFSCTSGQPYPLPDLSSGFTFPPTPWQGLTFSIWNIRSGPGYVTWEIEDRLSDFNDSALTRTVTKLYGAFYRRSSRSWEMRELGAYQGGGSASGYANWYDVFNILPNLSSVTWSVTRHWYLSFPNDTNNYSYTIPQQPL